MLNNGGWDEGRPIALWIDNDTTFRAFTFTKASSTSGNITNLDLYKDRVIVKHEGTIGTSTTNADLDSYDGDDDVDIPFKVTGANLDVNATTTLYVAPGSEFAPGGTVTLHGNALTANGDGDLRLATGLRQDGTASTSILTMGAYDLSVAGNWFASSTSIFTHTGTVTFTSTSSATKLIVATSSPFASTTFNGVSGSWSFGANAATTSGLFTITNGSVTATSTSLTILKDFAQNGTFNANGGSLIFGPVASVPTGPTYQGGADVTGATNSGAGNEKTYSHFVSGSYAYTATNNNATACSQTAGSAIGCELKVYDISNPGSPTYVGGADATGATNSGTGDIVSYVVFVSGDYAYFRSRHSHVQGRRGRFGLDKLRSGCRRFRYPLCLRGLCLCGERQCHESCLYFRPWLRTDGLFRCYTGKSDLRWRRGRFWLDKLRIGGWQCSSYHCFR